LPGQAKPEPAVLVLAPHQANASDHRARGTLESQRPMPCISTLDRREGLISIERIGTIGRIRPRDAARQEAHDLPLWKK
jgi:hypothetical protein